MRLQTDFVLGVAGLTLQVDEVVVAASGERLPGRPVLATLRRGSLAYDAPWTVEFARNPAYRSLPAAAARVEVRTYPSALAAYDAVQPVALALVEYLARVEAAADILRRADPDPEAASVAAAAQEQHR